MGWGGGEYKGKREIKEHHQQQQNEKHTHTKKIGEKKGKTKGDCGGRGITRESKANMTMGTGGQGKCTRRESITNEGMINGFSEVMRVAQ